MVTETKETSPFSIKRIFKSIISPSSSGREAAQEYIENNPKEYTNTVVKNYRGRLAREERVRGTFGTRRRLAQIARNQRTSEKISIKAANTPLFKADKKLKEKVKQ